MISPDCSLCSTEMKETEEISSAASKTPEGIIRMLIIQYVYIDKTIKISGLGENVKEYYTNNSRGKLQFQLTHYRSVVPYSWSQNEIKEAVTYTNIRKPKGFDISVHICNPKKSQTGNGVYGLNVITWNSITNIRHEVGHALGLHHANSMLNGVKRESFDMYDPMTSYASYASVNIVHRHLKSWFYPGELSLLDNNTSGLFTIRQLKDFADKTSCKGVKVGPGSSGINTYYISYNEIDDCYLTIHQLFGPKSSFIMFRTKDFTKPVIFETLLINVIKSTRQFITFDVINKV